jgi:hypothetical protein
MANIARQNYETWLKMQTDFLRAMSGRVPTSAPASHQPEPDDEDDSARVSK